MSDNNITKFGGIASASIMEIVQTLVLNDERSVHEMLCRKAFKDHFTGFDCDKLSNITINRILSMNPDTQEIMFNITADHVDMPEVTENPFEEEDNDLLSMEAIAWLRSVDYRNKTHAERMALIDAAKIAYPNKAGEDEGIRLLMTLGLA